MLLFSAEAYTEVKHFLFKPSPFQPLDVHSFDPVSFHSSLAFAHESTLFVGLTGIVLQLASSNRCDEFRAING